MRKVVWFVPLFLVLFAADAFADGFIIVPPHPPSRPQIRTIPLAVKYHRVKVTIHDQVAVTEIDQVFVNPNPYVLEGTYIFPIPENASLSAFSMYIDGKEVPAELLEKGKARKIYEDIVRSMRDPALLEYAGRDMFRASIFPIPANGEKRVKLSYQEVCSADNGLVRYRYPLNTEKFSSRPIDDVSVVVDIKGKYPIKNITCPTHRVEVVKKSDTEATVAYEAKRVVPDRDLVLYYALSKREFALNLLTHRPDPKQDGYFMLLLSPNTGEEKVMPKDVCFVMDTSGSMQGKKIQQARAALKFCIQALRPADRFDIVPFSTEARKFSPTLLDATPDNVAKAVAFVKGLGALGGTAIDDALTTALDLAPKSDRPYLVVFVTDGLPTIGETREEAILADVKAKSHPNVRLFTFGVGNDVNTHLLDKLAAENRGARDYVSESEDLEVKISSFFMKVANPVLSDLAVAFPGITVTDVYPHRLGDLFKGSQLTIVGRYHGSGASAVKLTGKLAGRETTFADDLTFPDKASDNSFLPRLWAIRKIGYLLDSIRLNGENAELKNEIVRLAKLYGIVTPYTSFLVMEDQIRRGRNTRLGAAMPLGGRDNGAVAKAPSPGAPAPAGARGGSGGGAGSGPAAGAGGAFGGTDAKDRQAAADGLDRATGGASVRASKEASKMKGDSPSEEGHGYVPDAGRDKSKAVMRLVEGTAFYKQGDVWVQADLPAKAERKALTLFSDDYFALVKKDPKVGKYLSLGKVDFLVDGVVYQVR